MHTEKRYRNGIYLSIDKKCVHLWRLHHGKLKPLPDSNFAEELTTGMRFDKHEIESAWSKIDLYCQIGGYSDFRSVTFERAEECKDIARRAALQCMKEEPLISELIYADVVERVQLNEGLDEFSYMKTMEACAAALWDTVQFHSEMFHIMGSSYDYEDLRLWKQEKVLTDHTLFQRNYQCELVPEENDYSLRYFFNRFSDYYAFVLLHFALEHRRMQVCELCGKVFVPKTKRITKYCNRINPFCDMPCNKIAPKHYMEGRQQRDPLLAEYEQARNQNYKRLERTALHGETTEKSLTYTAYDAWFREVSEARQRYLSDKSTADAFRKLIHKLD